MTERWTVHQGDVRKVLPTLEPRSFDAVLCDPPYELGFMGRRWDASGVAFDPKVWAAVRDAMRPGAHLFAFGGTRTFHRLTCAIEDGGLDIRDCFCWLYGAGFPKSLDVAKAIDKAGGHHRGKAGEKLSENAAMSAANYARTPKGAPMPESARLWEGMGTAAKPAWEPCILARVPLDGTVAHNVQEHGCGALAIDACRIQYESDDDRAAAAAAQRACQDQNEGRTAYGDFNNGPASLPGYFDKQTLGRWPANVLLDEVAAQMLDAQSGDRPGMTGGGQHRDGYDGGMFGGIDSTATARGDFGGASRFFFTAKASRADRDHGLIGAPALSAVELVGRDPDSAGAKSPRAGAGRTQGALRDGGRASGVGARNPHPTVKPTDLIEYLAKLILPPRGIGRPRRLLVPFCGSGSEMIGALRAGWDEVVGIEIEYAHIARERLTHADVAHQPSLFGAA